MEPVARLDLTDPAEKRDTERQQRVPGMGQEWRLIITMLCFHLSLYFTANNANKCSICAWLMRKPAFYGKPPVFIHLAEQALRNPVAWFDTVE